MHNYKGWLTLADNNKNTLLERNSCFHCYFVFGIDEIPKTHFTDTVRCPRCSATCVIPGEYSRAFLQKLAKAKFPDEVEPVVEIDLEEKPDTAVRLNKGKLDYTLLPHNALHYEAKVWHDNAKENGGKYEREQWKKLWGKDTPTTVMKSAWRHFMALHRGEVFDKDSANKTCHAALLRANMAMLIEYYVQEGILPKE
jgi:hypothetical protein